MSKINNCLSTVIEPCEDLVKQFAGYLLGSITDHSDLLIISPKDGLVRIEDDLAVAIQLLEITYPEANYIEYSIHYDTDSDEFDFLPTNDFTQILTSKMRDLE
ncbi:MAG: hypothetical protein JXR12_15355 [Neptunomonas phycophila]|uniref:hypothetical protein n=1 Tax=Neptunomonas phycophila TaxID=1572645 RepID=UPI003B8DFA54